MNDNVTNVIHTGGLEGVIPQTCTLVTQSQETDGTVEIKCVLSSAVTSHLLVIIATNSVTKSHTNKKYNSYIETNSPS